MVFTVHCESVGWLIAICASPTTAVLHLRNVSSFHRYSRQALPIKARGMKALRRLIIDMAATRPLSPADRSAQEWPLAEKIIIRLIDDNCQHDGRVHRRTQARRVVTAQ
jgi:hypothetical protein